MSMASSVSPHGAPLRFHKLVRSLVLVATLWLLAVFLISSSTWMLGNSSYRTVLLYLPVYLLVAFVCITGIRVGISIARFPNVPHEAAMLRDDFKRARNALREKGIPCDE